MSFSSVPREVVDAAAASGVGLCGTSDEVIPAAEEVLPANLCPLIKSTYGFAYSQKCPFTHFSDLIVGETTCDGKKKMYELLNELKPTYVLHLPQGRLREHEREGWYQEVVGLKEALERLYGIQITDDALRIKPGAQKIQLAGSLTEGTYIYKRDGYYYLFGSAGSCCEGANSTYRVVVARSTKLEGPYVNKSGGRALDNQFETILEGDDFVAGPGHNAEFIEDDNGDTWMIYHGYVRDRANEGRMVFLDKVQWKDGWPYFEGGHASRTSAAPYFKDQQ